MKNGISRNMIKAKLVEWSDGVITEKELHQWAENAFDNRIFDELDKDEVDPAIPEILQSLESMDMNLIVIQDIPIFMEFLNSSVQDFEYACNKLHQYFTRIDYDMRRLSLKSNAFYKLYV